MKTYLTLASSGFTHEFPFPIGTPWADPDVLSVHKLEDGIYYRLIRPSYIDWQAITEQEWLLVILKDPLKKVPVGPTGPTGLTG